MTAEALPFILTLGLFYGSTLVVSRFSIGQFEPSTYIGLRLVIATAGHLSIYLLTSRRWPRDRRLWKLAVPYGILGTAVPMVAIVTGLQFISSGLASILVTLNPAFVAILAHFTLKDEPLTRRKTAGVALALAGTALLALRGESGLDDTTGSLAGYMLLLLAALAGSISTIYARKYMQDLDSFDVASVRMGSAALTVMPLSLLLIGIDLTPVEPSGYLALFYASLIGTFSGMLLNFYTVKRFGALASATTAYIIPIVATIGGLIFLDEKITGWMIAGMAVIVVGITLLRHKKGALHMGV